MVVVWIMFFIMSLWGWASYVCFALVVSSPIGAIICWRLASRLGLAPGKCARAGAWYWAAGFVPWIYYLDQLNGRPRPKRLFNITYGCALALWLVGPVIGGSISGFPSDTGWLLVIPAANLAALAGSMVWRSFADAAASGDRYLRNCDVVPLFFAVVGMMSLLLYDLPVLLEWLL